VPARLIEMSPAQPRSPRPLLLACAGLALVFGLIPLPALVEWGNRISPWEGPIRAKTVLLFQYLHWVLPFAGLFLALWTFVPAERRGAIFIPIQKALASRRALLLALALSALICLTWIAFFPTRPASESVWYYEKGQQIARGLGYVYDLETRKPTAAFPVGYPAYLALVFTFLPDTTLVGRLANVPLILGIVFLGWRLARRLISPAAGGLAALTLALMPGLWVYSSILTSDPLFAFVTLLALDLTLFGGMQRRRQVLWGLAAGAVAGLAALTRSTGLALAPLWIGLRWIIFTHTYTTSLVTDDIKVQELETKVSTTKEDAQGQSLRAGRKALSLCGFLVLELAWR